jgi:hypothetical protein
MFEVDFEGDRHGAASYLAQLGRRYYVYVLCRPNGQPFYVGKGVGRRALEHELEARRAHPIGETNPFKCNVIRKILANGGAIKYLIDSHYDPAEEASCLVREAELIEQHKRLHEGGCLTNLAGGIGSLSGPAPFSVQKHSATLSGEPEGNPDRATLNRFLLSIGPVESVPIKPINQIARILPSTPHPSARSPSLRCAYALVASASATGVTLSDGAIVQRRFAYCGVEAVMENGVCRDLLKARMGRLIEAQDPRDEAFHLDRRQVDILVGLLGEPALVARGLL